MPFNRGDRNLIKNLYLLKQIHCTEFANTISRKSWNE